MEIFLTHYWIRWGGRSDGPISEHKSLVRQIVDRIVIDRDRKVAKCYVLAMPKSAGKIVEEIIENSRTHVKSVPPTGFPSRPASDHRDWRDEARPVPLSGTGRRTGTC